MYRRSRKISDNDHDVDHDFVGDDDHASDVADRVDILDDALLQASVNDSSGSLSVSSSHSSDEACGDIGGLTNEIMTDEAVIDDDYADWCGESNDENDHSDPVEFQEELAKWASSARLTRVQGNQLMALLRRYGHPDLPRDYRTLLKIPATIDTVDKAGGRCVEFGLEKSIIGIIESGIPVPDSLQLKVNIDGLPLHKDGSGTLWPLLVSTDEIPLLLFHYGMVLVNHLLHHRIWKTLY